jgi:hypothetical protein
MSDRPFIDYADAADLRLSEVKHTSTCPRCGALEPVRIEAGVGCDQCASFPRCHFCRRWVGDGPDLWPYVRVLLDTPDGRPANVCDPCMERIDDDRGIEEPVDYTEDDMEDDAA